MDFDVLERFGGGGTDDFWVSAREHLRERRDSGGLLKRHEDAVVPVDGIATRDA